MSVYVYMGLYVKDREEGKYNDYVTYDENPEADYKSYMNLITGNVYNIGLDKCKLFEMKNIILDIPVVSYSYDAYLSNSTKIRNWFLQEIKIRNKENVIEELRQQYEKRTQIEELTRIRENVKGLEYELSKIEEKKVKLQDKIQIIRNFCNHEVGVKTQKADQKSNRFSKATCLICNQKYSSPFDWNFPIPFRYIIHFEDEEFSNLTEEEKVQFAFNMFEENKKKNPKFSDAQVVETINYLKNNKSYINGKVLSNKPDLKN